MNCAGTTSSRCDTSYFEQIRADFAAFADPLVYTPGDNEWTDCHRANNGGYQPYERLAFVRQTFFAQPGKTLGQQSVGVQSQADRGFPEQVRYSRAGVAFGVPHIVGSNNGLAPWTGLTEPTSQQVTEVVEPER